MPRDVFKTSAGVNVIRCKGSVASDNYMGERPRV